MGRTRALAAATAATLLVAVPLAAAPAFAATSPVPATLDSTTTRTASVDIDVPSGVTPTAITGVLNMDQVPAGDIELLVNGRVVQRVPTTLYAKVRIPVSPGDVTAGRTIGLSLRYAAPASSPAADCPGPQDVGAVLRKVTLVHSGSERAPETIGAFFPETSPRIDVVVPEDADDELLGAGLAAVAALTVRYPQDTEVALRATKQEVRSVGIGHRVVKLSPGGELLSAALPTAVTVPTLAIEATGETLTEAVQALAYPLDSITSSQTNDLSVEIAGAEEVEERSLIATLESLGADQLTLTGWGRTTAVVPVPLDAFGGPVDELDLTLVGNHTAIPQGASAQLDVYLNDTLVDSVDLVAGATTADAAPAAAPAAPGDPGDPAAPGAPDGPDIDLRTAVPVGAVRGDNELRLVLTALPAGGCLPTTGIVPSEVAINVAGSFFTATRGEDHLPGFAGFPAVLEGELEVGLRDSGDGLDAAAVRAARLVAELQRGAARPLEVRLVDPDELVASSRPGLLVGATYNDSVALQTPIRLNSTRVLDMVGASMRAESSQPFAALQASKVDDRQVLSLGSWAPDGGSSAPKIANRITLEVGARGWSGLEGDILLGDASNSVTAITSDLAPRTSTRQSDLQDEGRSWLFWVFTAGIVVLLGLVLLQLAFAARRAWRYRREERRARRQEEASRPQGLIAAVARGNRPEPTAERTPEGADKPTVEDTGPDDAPGAPPRA